MDRFFPESLWKDFWEKHKTDRRTFLFTFGMGILLYLRMITQWLANPDGVWQGLIYKKDYSWENILGRTGLEWINRWKGYYQFPALQTIICIAAAALIAVLLCRLFRIQNAPWNYVAGGLVICSPSLCSTMTYYYTADAYMAAYLVAVLFVWCIAEKWSVYRYVLAVALLAASAFVYQAYIGSAITLCLLYLLVKLLRQEESVKELCRKALQFLAAGVSGVIGYLVLYKLLCRFQKITPVADRGFDSMGHIPLGRLPGLIKQAYHYFFSYYFTDELYCNSWMGRGKWNALAGILLIAVLIVYLICRRHDKTPLFLAVLGLGLLLLPIAFMSIVIMAPEVSIADVTGILMLPHMNWIYILLIVLVIEIKGTDVGGLASQWAVLISIIGVIYVLVLYTQVFQNCMEMDLHRVQTLGGQIAQAVNNETDYTPGIPLLVGGNAEKGNYPRSYEQMYLAVQGTAAEYGMFWNSLNGRQYCWNQFFRQYMGLEYETITGERAERILNSQEYAEMSLFPAEGSVKVVEGCVVVKLSD